MTEEHPLEPPPPGEPPPDEPKPNSPEDVGFKTSTCRSCGAPIEWVSLENARGERKPHPVDPSTEKRIVRYGRSRMRAKMVAVYVSHFATCPNAAGHRRS